MSPDHSQTQASSAGWLGHWRLRHQTPLSFWLHMVGIPLAVLAVLLAGWQLLLWRWDLWWRPAGLLGGGYLLQWLGHLHEGNDMGEVILIKRWLGQPYTAVAPQFTGLPQTADVESQGQEGDDGKGEG